MKTAAKNFSMKHEITEEEYAALVILRGTGLDVVQVAMLAREALAANRGRVARVRKCLALGAQELQRQERTVSFRRAVEEALSARQHRRARTLVDFRYICRRLMKRCRGLAERRVRSIRPEECAAWLEAAFESSSQRHKARAILSGVFSTAVKRGWCESNPVARVERPQVRETRLPVLSPQEIEQITRTAAEYEGGLCAAAVGMMLYAGIRPHEVARLSWAQVDLQERVIYIHPSHSKTGGARRVTIHPPLLRILQRQQQEPAQRICPPNWQKHWRELRRQAGWDNAGHRWRQDALRHTFASYHLSYFRSYTELQFEMGHRDAALLRTRYVDQRGVRDAPRFWGQPERREDIVAA